MAGLKRRKIGTGETREHGTKKWLDCACGESCLVDGKADTVTCSYCVQKQLGAPEKKAKKKT